MNKTYFSNLYLLFFTIVCVFLFNINLNTSEASTVFVRSLNIGKSGTDVKELQILLNRSVDTRVATQGPGSPGNETSYFGTLTRSAVISFQNKYAQEVLKPWNLTRGTGFVGSTTRKKLNELRIPTSSGPGVTTPQEINKPPIINSISPSKISDGTRVTLHGLYFSTEENTIVVNHTQSNKHPVVSSSDGKTLEFTLNTETGQFIKEKLEQFSKTELQDIEEAYSSPIEMRVQVSNKNGASNVVLFNYSPF